jgi:hypothetical protein
MPFPDISRSVGNRARFNAAQQNIRLSVFFKAAGSEIGAPNKNVDLRAGSEQVKLRVKDLSRIKDHPKPFMPLPSLKKTGIGVMECAADDQSAHFCPDPPKKVLHSFLWFSRPCYGNLNVVSAVHQFGEASVQKARVCKEFNVHLPSLPLIARVKREPSSSHTFLNCPVL